jgi:hypothetical protein
VALLRPLRFPQWQVAAYCQRKINSLIAKRYGGLAAEMLRRYRDSWPNTLWPQQPNFKAKQEVKKREKYKREISKSNRGKKTQVESPAKEK